MIDGRFSELEAVLVVARCKSFRAAARELQVSPSALSHAVAALERRLGARLFQRTTRSVGLTAEGEQLTARVGPALGEIGSALAAVREQGGAPSGTLRLTASRGAVHFGIIDVLAELRARHRDVHVELSTQERLVDIVAEGYDAGIRLAEVVPLDMIAVPYGPELSMAILGAPEYFARRKKPRAPADLLEHDCIRRRKSDGTTYRWELEKRGREQQVDVRGALTFDDDVLTLHAAAAGLGLAFTSTEMAAPLIEQGKLVRVMADWTPPFPGLRVFYPTGQLVRPVLRAFIDIVKERNRKAKAKTKHPR